MFRIAAMIRAMPGLVLLWGLPTMSPALEPPSLQIEIPNKAPQQLLLTGDFDTRDGEKLVRILVSQNLTEWKLSGQSLNGFIRLPVRMNEGADSEYFRADVIAVDSSSDWASQIHLADRSLFTPVDQPGNNGVQFLKFTIDLHDRNKIYYQDSGKHPFHYLFARERIPGVDKMGPQEYARVSLYAEEQRYALGTLLLSPDTTIPEIGIQFSAAEPFPVAQKIAWINWVRDNVIAPEETQFIYMPSIEQLDITYENLPRFSAAQIEVGDIDRWINEDTCYSQGWTIGTLKFVKGADIQEAFLNGDITHSDILVTDILPSEIPNFAGIILLNPVTPNSHAILLARSHGVPVFWPSGIAQQERILGMDGKYAFFHIPQDCAIRLVDVSDSLTELEIEEILKTKSPPPPEISPRMTLGKYAMETARLDPSMISIFGGKASNAGVMIRAIPNHAPSPSVSISFDLWQDVLNLQYRHTTQTIGEAISNELSQFIYPADAGALHASMFQVRKWIRESRWHDSMVEEILEALSGFDPVRKIRFRSSTNVEDSTTFSGAGLYDSFSGCLADDLDNDDDGPSHCDPTQPNERGVIRALKKVLASFYNDNAFSERLRFGIAESKVGMAVMAHHSFPDELELANGVITVTMTTPSNEPATPDSKYTLSDFTLVAHPGAESITNPDNAITPEIVHWSPTSGWQTQSISSLSQNESHAMTFPQDYDLLRTLSSVASQALIPYLPVANTRSLDLEFKKMKNDGIIIKQIRPIPDPFIPPVPHL